MTSREFCYWLQGYFEVNERGETYSTQLNKEQLKIVKKHLAMVFKHEIDPSYPNGQLLNEMHSDPNTGMYPGGTGGVTGTSSPFEDDGLIRC